MFPLEIKIQGLATKNYFFFFVYSVEEKACEGCTHLFSAASEIVATVYLVLWQAVEKSFWDHHTQMEEILQSDLFPWGIPYKPTHLHNKSGYRKKNSWSQGRRHHYYIYAVRWYIDTLSQARVAME